MKYINLLPPELQAKATVSWQMPRLSSKGVIGYLVIPGLVLVVFWGGIVLVHYRYKQKIKGIFSQEVLLPATDEPKPRTTVPSTTVIQRQSPSKLPPPPVAEKRVSPALVTTDAHPSSSSRAKTEEPGYSLRLGSFTTLNEAEALMEKIRRQKLEPYQQTKQIIKKVSTVYVGQASNMEEAVGLTQQLEADGFEAFIKLHSQGAYWIGVERFSYWAGAQKLAERLLSLGYPARIVPEQLPLTIYQVNLGYYDEYRQAKSIQNILEEQGYRFISIIKE